MYRTKLRDSRRVSQRLARNQAAALVEQVSPAALERRSPQDSSDLRSRSGRQTFLPPIWDRPRCAFDCATAAELSKIDRTIAKEPKYQSKPKYCLLVFGPEAKTKVWLVLDGDVLYVDRNGNGDLTEENKKVNGKRLSGQEIKFEGKSLASEGVPSNARVEVLLVDPLTFVYCQVPGKPWQRAVVDKTGNLSFGKSPDAAPIIHFNGPLTLAPRFDQPFQRGANATDFDVMVGTPGLGIGTFARLPMMRLPKTGIPSQRLAFLAETGSRSR